MKDFVLGHSQAHIFSPVEKELLLDSRNTKYLQARTEGQGIQTLVWTKPQADPLDLSWLFVFF